MTSQRLPEKEDILQARKNEMVRIILIGYMGAGKTTLGKALAKALGFQFVDLDWYIENRYRKSVKEIFSEKGEDGFRKIEQSMLHETAEFENIIISAGGGTPCFFDNISYMNRQAKTVYLKTSNDVLFHRLKIAKSKRPLLAQKTDDELKAFIEKNLEEREPFYSKADYIFSADRLEDKFQIDESVNKLRSLLNI